MEPPQLREIRMKLEKEEKQMKLQQKSKIMRGGNHNVMDQPEVVKEEKPNFLIRAKHKASNMGQFFWPILVWVFFGWIFFTQP